MFSNTNLIKKFLNILTYLIYLFISVIIILEITFRILPTTTPVDLKKVLKEDEILRFKPNKLATFSLGANFYKTVKKRTNNYGFYSSYDYVSDSEPDIIIIGDSYVEAAQIKNKDTIGEILNDSNINLSVYQLGVSGVALSQYLKMVRYAKREFSPKHFVIIIVGNDFDQSLCSYRIKEGTWCYNDNYKIIFNPFRGYKGLRAIARRSAFMRYLVFQNGLDWRSMIYNLGFHDDGLSAVNKYAGNVERSKPTEITIASKNIIDLFFKELLKMDLKDKITIVLDADRNDIYENTVTNSYFNDMRLKVIQSASKNKIKLVDLDLIFRNNYSKYLKKYEFPTDGHWNERAHKLISQALIKNIEF